MTHNIFVKCDVCGSILDLKWQIGYLPKSEFMVSCGKCKSTIKGTLYTNNKDVKLDYDIVNATEIENHSMYECDFIIPISGELITEKMRRGTEQYKPTPFINLTMLIGFNNFSIYQRRYLTGVNKLENEKNIYDRFNELYSSNQFDYLRKELSKNFNIKIKQRGLKETLEQKYNFDINFLTSFTNIARHIKIREKIFKNLKKLKGANKLEYEKLLLYFAEDIDKFEKKLRETLNIFLNNYNYFIPVISLEYINKEQIEEIFNKYALTTVDFEDVRSLYLRIYENIMESSILLIGLNNIVHRGDYSKIDDTIIARKNTIEQYKEMSKGNRLKYTLTNETFNSIFPNFDKDIRNAIGHEDIEYDIFNQKLIYKDGKSYLLEYVYNLWQCYEHCLLLYEIILDTKFNLLKLQNKL